MFVNPKCDYCGRFYKWEDGDEYTRFGRCDELEPPDPTFLCGTCAENGYRGSLADGRPEDAWRLAKYMRRAAKKLGFVRATPKGAVWGQWFREGTVPDGYEAEVMVSEQQ